MYYYMMYHHMFSFDEPDDNHRVRDLVDEDTTETESTPTHSRGPIANNWLPILLSIIATLLIPFMGDFLAFWETLLDDLDARDGKRGTSSELTHHTPLLPPIGQIGAQK